MQLNHCSGENSSKYLHLKRRMNEQPKKEIKKTTKFTIASKRIKP
jgi:hypothetical protein